MNALIREIFHLFTSSHLRWLLYILTFEYLVAVTLSPTILSDYALANYFVEKMSFLPAVHIFDSVAREPEAVSFFIALGFVLLIPKSVCLYFWLAKNPYSLQSEFVITPYTSTKPSKDKKFTDGLTEEDAKKLPTDERSMFGRIVLSLFTLGLTAIMVWGPLFLGRMSERSLRLTKAIDHSIASGGVDMWFGLSVCRISIASFFIAIALFIIKDYYLFFQESLKKIWLFFK